MNVEARARACEVGDCPLPLGVGIGAEPRWVCFEHFEEYLADAAGLLARLRTPLRAERL